MMSKTNFKINIEYITLVLILKKKIPDNINKLSKTFQNMKSNIALTIRY